MIRQLWQRSKRRADVDSAPVTAVVSAIDNTAGQQHQSHILILTRIILSTSNGQLDGGDKFLFSVYVT